MKRIGYKHTVAASFTAFVVQAVVNNFAPLLFLTFQAQYGIELSKITVLITANFFIQIFVDLTAVLFVDRIGYRASTVLAHAMCATGLIFMTILPEILPSAFAGLLISVFCYAVGAGLLDITINPIVNSCPSTNSNQLLCLLHSFYCWGSVAAVGISTLFFALFSTDNWKIMSLIWAILPIVNAVMFTRAYSARRRRGRGEALDKGYAQDQGILDIHGAYSLRRFERTGGQPVGFDFR